jgi:flagellin-specific chaperone FliS
MASIKHYEIEMYERALAIGSTPFERLSTLYTGAIRLCKQGFSLATAGDVAGAAAKAERLAAVLKRLDLCLDFSIAPDLCKNLNQLYVHMQAQLTSPSIGAQPEIFTETLGLLETLWDGFKGANQRDQSLKS